MAHFKRGRAKNRRAGCLMCKPHKANGIRKRCGSANGAKLHDGRRTWKQELQGALKEKEGRQEMDDSEV